MNELNLESLELQTEHLLLKVIDEEFADRVLDYYLRNREFLKDWEPNRDEEFYTLEYHQNALHQELDTMKHDQAFRVWIFKKSEGLNRTIGSIGLSNIVRGAFQSCHVGYKLDGEEINQGYLTEGLKAVIKYAFTTLKLHRLEANILPRNRRSLRVVEKLGFYDEGLAKNYLRINGKWEDHLHKVLLNEAME